MKKRTLDLISLALILPAVGMAAYRFSPGFRATVLVALGRSPSCSWSQAIKSAEMLAEHTRIADQMAASLKVVRQDGALKLWDTPRGQFWMPSGDTDLLKALLSEQERKIYGDSQHGVQPGDIVLDCGAHVGVYTREAVKAGAKLVVAIEPAPSNAECLRRNLATEIAAGKVIVYQKGVWNKQGHLTFHVDPANSAGSSIVFSEAEKKSGDLRIAVNTIDAITQELKLSRVDFIKMDIEGSERHAVEGARDTLAKYKPTVVLCAYHMPDDAIVLPQVVATVAPWYRMNCGPCGEMGGRIIPHTLFFR